VSAYRRHVGYTRSSLPDASRARLLRSLRILLPALVAVLVGLALLLPEIFPGSGRAPVDITIAKTGPEAGGKGMVNITYSGIDKEGRPFSISADSVDTAPVRADLLLLTRPYAHVLSKDGAKLTIAADSGVYDRARESVDLREQVTLWRGTDLTIRTSQARVELAAGEAFGDQLVDGEASVGALAGKGFHIADSGNRIFLEGPARLLIRPGAEPRLP
jgi:lipopolysaccharide export system protein LptC